MRYLLLVVLAICLGLSPECAFAATISTSSPNIIQVNAKKNLWCYRTPSNARRIGKLQNDGESVKLYSSSLQSLSKLKYLMNFGPKAKRATYKSLYYALKACLKAVFPTATATPTPTPTATATATPTGGINQAPLAAIDAAAIETIGQQLALSGANSHDPDGNPLTFTWALAQKPAGSVASLSGANAASASFAPDIAGNYVVGLSVSDGQLASPQQLHTIQVVPGFHVGPGRVYSSPSAVSNLVQDGHTVLIDAGTYVADVARWNRNNLTLMGLGGYAHLNANGQSYGGKAIWVIQGNNTTVKNIEFSGCSVIDHNGAGIRQEGPNLTVVNSYFHDNEEGILANDNPSSTIIVSNSTFLRNGYQDGKAHNIYVNHVGEFWLMFSNISLANVGHNVKSRAYRNFIIYNRIMDEVSGSASYEIDLPNGGTSFIIGNAIQQGPATQNSIIISYAEEGATNPQQDLYLVNNTIVNDRQSGGTFIRSLGPVPLVGKNNLFVGPGTILNGLGTLSSNGTFANAAAAGLANAAAYDYALLGSSPAINAGIDPGSAVSLPLTPTEEYVHPAASKNRAQVGALDLGAFEFGP